MVLALTGNALMVPRALLTNDRVWLTGATWSLSVAGWGQLLSMFVNKSPETGWVNVGGGQLLSMVVNMLQFA